MGLGTPRLGALRLAPRSKLTCSVLARGRLAGANLGLCIGRRRLSRTRARSVLARGQLARSVSSASVVTRIGRGQETANVHYHILGESCAKRYQHLGLFLHCSGLGASMWNRVEELVDSSSNSCCAFNLFGMRESSMPCIEVQEMRLRYQAFAIAEAVQAQYQHAGPVRLVGHSYGGSVAIKVAQELMARGFEVKSLVLYEANCFHLLPNDGPGKAGEHRATVKRLVHAKLSGDDDVFGRIFADLWWGGGWDTMPNRAKIRLIRMLKTLAAEGFSLLNEKDEDIKASLGCLAAIQDKHFLYGDHPKAAPMIVELATNFLPELGFSIFSFPVESGIAHMGPQSHPNIVLPVLIKQAGFPLCTNENESSTSTSTT